MSLFPKDVLNKLRWTGNPTLAGIKIWVLHRGAPNDRKVIPGEEVIDLENSFFVVKRSEGSGDGRLGDAGSTGWEVEKETRIPYHRIQRIYLTEGKRIKENRRKERSYDRMDYSTE